MKLSGQKLPTVLPRNATGSYCLRATPPAAERPEHAWDAMRTRPRHCPEPCVLIIAYGNPLRGDDGVAWHIAEQLAAAQGQSPLKILTRHQLTPELAEAISQANLVIFVDASVGQPPGTISCVPVGPEMADQSSHQFDPASLMFCAREIYGSAPKALLCTIAGEDFGYEERLSPTILAAMPKLLQRIRALIAAHEESN